MNKLIIITILTALGSTFAPVSVRSIDQEYKDNIVRALHKYKNSPTLLSLTVNRIGMRETVNGLKYIVYSDIEAMQHYLVVDRKSALPLNPGQKAVFFCALGVSDISKWRFYNDQLIFGEDGNECVFIKRMGEK